MGNPYIKPTLTGYNANPPTDDNAPTPENQVEWAKHKDKLGDPLKVHTEGDADNTETAFGVRLLNNTIVTAVTYTVTVPDRGKIIYSVADGIDVNLPDVTNPDVTVGFEVPVTCQDAASPRSLTIKPVAGQSIDGIVDNTIPLTNGEFAFLTSVSGGWRSMVASRGIGDAPSDGNTYGRKDAAWSQVPPPAIGGQYSVSDELDFTSGAPTEVALNALTPAFTGTPKRVAVDFVAQGDSGGYTTGQRLTDVSAPNVSDGYNAYYDDSVVGVMISTTGVSAYNKTTGTFFSVASPTWKVQIHVWS